MNKTSRFFDLLITLIQKDFKVRYKRTYLGYLWSIALPLAQAVVFFAVFKIVMRFPMEDYSLFLISGLFLWQWIANSISSSLNVYISNAQIIKKVHFEVGVLPLSTVLIDMFHFLVSIPVLIVFLYIFGKTPNVVWLVGIPVVILLVTGFVYGLSLVVSALNLFFRDVERLMSVFLMLWFYLTPVIYPLEMVPEEYQRFFMFNPAAIYVELWRGVAIEGVLHFDMVLLGTAFSLGTLFVGLYVHRRLKSRFAEVL